MLLQIANRSKLQKAAKNVEERRRCRHKFWIIDWRHFLPIVEKINDKSISTLHAENNGVGPKTVKTIVKSDTEKTPIWYTILEIWFKKVMKFGIVNKFKQLFLMKQIHKNIKNLMQGFLYRKMGLIWTYFCKKKKYFFNVNFVRPIFILFCLKRKFGLVTFPMICMRS